MPGCYGACSAAGVRALCPAVTGRARQRGYVLYARLLRAVLGSGGTCPMPGCYGACSAAGVRALCPAVTGCARQRGYVPYARLLRALRPAVTGPTPGCYGACSAAGAVRTLGLRRHQLRAQVRHLSPQRLHVVGERADVVVRGKRRRRLRDGLLQLLLQSPATRGRSKFGFHPTAFRQLQILSCTTLHVRFQTHCYSALHTLHTYYGFL